MVQFDRVPRSGPPSLAAGGAASGATARDDGVESVLPEDDVTGRHIEQRPLVQQRQIVARGASALRPHYASASEELGNEHVSDARVF